MASLFQELQLKDVVLKNRYDHGFATIHHCQLCRRIKQTLI